MAIAPGLKRKGGLFGSTPMMDTIPPEMTATQQPLAPAKPKFFGEGGVGRSIAGNIGDFLLQYSGMDPIFAPAMQQKQAMAYDQQQREAQRQQQLKDWVWKEEYERRNPKPVNNDTVADYQFIVQNLGEEAGKEYLRNKANPPQYRQGPDGQFYRIDVAPGQMPSFTQDDWDKASPSTGGTSGTPAGGRF